MDRLCMLVLLHSVQCVFVIDPLHCIAFVLHLHLYWNCTASLLNKVACTEQFPRNVVTLLHRIQTSFQLLKRVSSEK